MGLVMRDGINRLRHAKRYSGFQSTICVNMAWLGFEVGTGKLMGVDPREMAQSDLIVIWGTNAANTQVNVVTHATRGRRRGAKIVVIDPYRNPTAQQADLYLCVRPGTDGALACAVMHVLFRDGHADWDYLERYTDAPRDLERHLRERTPEWAAAITGLTADEIERFAHMVGTTRRTFFRLGFGFTRSRNGPVAMHAALSIPAVTGAWQYEGGGAFKNNEGLYRWDRSLIEGLDVRDDSGAPARPVADRRRAARRTGRPARRPAGHRPAAAETGLLLQNTNPMMVAPDLNKVHRGFARDDLFTAVHEQFMTDTAKMADIVLPATMFLEHDDIYQGGGHQFIMPGARVVEPPENCRDQPLRDLRARQAARRQPSRLRDDRRRDHRLDAQGLRLSGPRRDARAPLGRLPAGLRDLALSQRLRPPGREISFSARLGRDAAPHHDGPRHGARHLRVGRHARAPRPLGRDRGADGSRALPAGHGACAQLPQFELHRDPDLPCEGEAPDREAPPRRRPNGSASPTATRVSLGNRRGALTLHAALFDGLQPGVVVVESIWPNQAFEGGIGINALTGADPIAPIGGAAFHDNSVWLRPA